MFILILSLLTLSGCHTSTKWEYTAEQKALKAKREASRKADREVWCTNRVCKEYNAIRIIKNMGGGDYLVEIFPTNGHYTNYVYYSIRGSGLFTAYLKVGKRLDPSQEFFLTKDNVFVGDGDIELSNAFGSSAFYPVYKLMTYSKVVKDSSDESDKIVPKS